MFLRQSTASQTRLTPRFVDSTDFLTPKTGLTIANTDVKLSKNAGTSANKNSGGGTHIEGGRYALTFDATDSNTVGELAVGINISGALPVEFKFFVLEEAVYDAFYAASAVGYVTDQPVNTTKVGGTTQTAKDLGALNVTNVNTLASHDPGETIMGATDLGTGSGFTSLATATNLAAAKTVVDAIKLKTDNLPSDPADESLIIAATDAITSALATVDGNVDAIKLVTDKLDDTLELDSTVYRFTTNALEQAPTGSGSGLDAAGVRTALGLATANLDTQLAAIQTAADAASTFDPATDTVTVGTNADKTGYALTTAYDAAKTAASQTSVDDVPTNAELTTALSGLSTFDASTDTVTLDVAYDAAKTAAQQGDAMALVADALDATALAASGGTEIAAAVATNASTTPLKANITKVNNVTLGGAGTSESPWGPA